MLARSLEKMGVSFSYSHHFLFAILCPILFVQVSFTFCIIFSVVPCHDLARRTKPGAEVSGTNGHFPN